MSRPKMTKEQKAEAALKRKAAQAPADPAPAKVEWSPTPDPAAPPAEWPAELEPPEALVSPPVKADLPSLADYIKARERDGVVLVRVTYPGAEPHVFPSKYSGVTVADGELSCLYADGSTD